MADHRYYEAWKRNPQSVAKPKSGAKAATTTAAPTKSVQVRLDTPGGVTYSPDELHSHNLLKRLFIPYKLGEGSGRRSQEDGEENQEGKGEEKMYNFDEDLRREAGDGKVVKGEGEMVGQEAGISAAQAYALSIDFDKLAEKREKAEENTRDGGILSSSKDMAKTEEEERRLDDELMDPYTFDSMSISGQSRMSTSSQMTTSTLATMSSARKDGTLPDWYTRVSANRDNVPFTVPAGMTGKATDHKRPWDAMKWHGHRAFERPSQREKETGIAAFEDVNGIGRAPSIAETMNDDGDYDDGDDDAKTIKTARTSRTTKMDALAVPDLFVVDPRKSHPLRMVRRTDPRQVLLLCNGICIAGAQVAAAKAAQAARQAGIDIKDLSSNSKEAQKILASVSASAQPRGGIGIVYCPHDDALSQDEEGLKKLDAKIDINSAKRLEAPPAFSETTEKRAQLRAALAAVELADWEEEGFDKIVIGVEQDWIVRGISNDIWRWKHNGWKTPVGEAVPDRDLWELLDQAIIQYEKIDCNVRFWQISSKDARLARRLAEMGAMKDLQRPKLVRWRRKMPSVLAEAKELQEAKRKKRMMMSMVGQGQENHQGPTLREVR